MPALTGHSAVYWAVIVHRNGCQVARLRCRRQVWLRVCTLPEAAEPDTAGRDSTEQQQEGSEQDKPGQGGARPLPLDCPLVSGHLFPGGSHSPVAQDKAMHRIKENQDCLSRPDTSFLARVGPEDLAWPGLLLLGLPSCCWACPGCLSRVGHKWPWVPSQDTLPQASYRVPCSDQ